MRYNVAQLLKEPIGSERSYQLDEEFTGPQRIADMARGPVHVLRTHQGVLVRAALETRSTLSCGRCVGGFERTSTLYIEEEFFPTVDVRNGRGLVPPAEAETRRVIDVRHVLDLSEVIREYAVTDLPMKPLCRPDCAGLCQVCGANLNVAQCGCGEGHQETRREALAGLLQRPKS